MLVAVGYWPREIEFEMQDLATVIEVLNNQAKESRRAR
jgi:hypothetical protein